MMSPSASQAILTSLLLVVLSHFGECFSSGAPSAACGTLSPDPASHGAQPQGSLVPYSIDLSVFDVGGGVFEYIPGNTYTITLSGNSGESFRGLLIQGRQRADDSTVLGTFSDPGAGASTRLSSCSDSAGAVTHSSPSIRTSESFTWTAPSAGSGMLWFGFSVVQQRVTYWSNHRTQVIAEQVVDCGTLIPPTNGQLTFSAGTVVNSVATYTCDSGSTLVGSASRICQANGLWSGSAPTCALVDCGTLLPPTNGQLTFSAGTVFSSVATYTCDSGSTLVGSASRICQANGLWSGSAPTCALVDCGTLLPPTNGQLTFSAGTVFSSVATYTCDSGSTLVGSASRICQANGLWSGSAPTCALVDCGTLLPPTNGQLTFSAGTVVGSTATYSCDTGFNLIGNAGRTCQADGLWSGVAPTCSLVDCGTLLPPTNGQLTFSAGTGLNSVATYTCLLGAVLVGNSNRVCQSNGQWSGVAPTCELVDCGQLPDPTNGLVTLTGTVVGSTATYSCDTGFNLVGNTLRTCQANGQWFGATPICEVVDCGTLLPPTNGQLTFSAGTVVNSIATYTCDPGSTLVGNVNRVCLASGQWSGVDPTCELVDCGQLPDPTNGLVTLTGAVLGSTATYSCDTGFNLVGSTLRTCQANGLWSGSAPTCEAQAGIVLQLSSSIYTSGEGDSFISIRIIKTGITALDIDVVINLADGTALGGLDYGPFPVAEVNVTHTIPAASSESLFGIQIREDTIVEETETFSVEIFLAPNQPGVMIGAVNRATVFINDNDDRMGLGGDPHYSILLPNGGMLCYSVQGEHGFTFNLISNKQLQMNALFVPDSVREEVTWIGALGVVVKHSAYKDSHTTKLRFALEGKMLFIGDKVQLNVKNIDKITLSEGKLKVSERAEDIKVPEVKVELKDVGLSFYVRYMSSHLDMVWDRVGTQPKDSHGMIGQFFRPGVDIDETRRMLVLPTMNTVPIMRRPVWSFMEREGVDDQLCWTAMNPGYQGKGLLEGHYLDYLVDDVLSDKFKFKPKHSDYL